jgi:NitT/TauT family transport system ATP-binding protein
MNTKARSLFDLQIVTQAMVATQFALSRDPAVVTSTEFVRMKSDIFGMLREEALTAQRQEVMR